MKTWKFEACQAYRKLCDVVALLDFNYPIELADAEMERALKVIETDFNIKSSPQYDEYIPKDDQWKDMLTKLIGRIKEAMSEKDEFKREERYCDLLNYCTNFVEINED